jgi:O-antigen ligase
MSTWSTPSSSLQPKRRVLATIPGHLGSQSSTRLALFLTSLVAVLFMQGFAITQSYLWAAPLLCLLLVAVAPQLPLPPLLGLILLVRVLTDHLLSSPTSRNTSSLNLSGIIAALFIILAFALLLHNRRGIRTVSLLTLFLLLWTVVAIGTHGASTVTIREGVREASILAVGVIVYNSRGVINTSLAARLIQIVGALSAIIAIYQFATHSGLLIAGQVRSNGTFTHPNGAAVFFALATIVSLWRYLDNGRKHADALFSALFSAATISTFSLSGLVCLLTMLIVFGALRSGSYRIKLGAFAAAALVAIAFLATPLGAERIANESSTQFSSAETRGTANTSLAWRFYKWRTLIPEWERAPFIGQGIGTTITVEGTSEYITGGKVPHNEYVRYLVETGVIGLVIIFAAIGGLFRSMSRLRKSPSTSDQAVLGIAIMAGCLVNALVDNTLLYSTSGYALALILAAILSSSRAATPETMAV